MEQRYINYVGPSMNPLLMNGDGLAIVPYKEKPVRRGDVIVFFLPERQTKIVHRVVSVDARGIRTRGDNARTVDPWVLTRENILGRVVYIQRKNRRRHIAGGLKGRLIARSIRLVRSCDAALSCLCRPIYHRLSRSAFLRRRLYRLLKPRVLAFSRSDGIELQLVVKRRLVGRRLPGKRHWEIRRPFRIFVDEEALLNDLPDKITACGASGSPAQRERL